MAPSGALPVQHSVPLLRVVQINLNKCLTANDELLRLAPVLNWDIFLLQEPHLTSRGITSLPGIRVISAGKTPRAAIAVNNSQLSVFAHPDLSDEYTCVATISSATDSFVFVSAYHRGKPKHNLPSNAADIQKLSSIVSFFPNKKICLGLDTNAYASDWGSPDFDNRGRALADFLAFEGLIILNDGITPTYCHQTTLAQSFIDVTAVSPALSPFIDDWCVSLQPSLSDHRFICFEIRLSCTPVNMRTHSKRYNVKRADWDCFRRQLEDFKPVFRQLIDTAQSPEDVEALSATYMEIVASATANAIPLARQHDRSKGWWDPSLTVLRREVRRLRNRLKGRPSDFVQRHAAYKAAYHEYRHAQRKSRLEAFKRFCTVDSSDPWGSMYKMLKPKRQIYAPLKPLLRSDGTLTGSEPETIGLLFEKYFPLDDPAADTALEAEARADASLIPLTDDDPPFSESEVRATVWRMKTRKCPGFDLITAPILRQIIEVLLPEITLWFNKCLSLGCFPSPFKRALIKFIPKPNHSLIQTAKAYRPICLLPSVGKSLDSLLIKRIEWSLKTRGELSANQFGFTPQTSTVDAILGVTDLTETYRKRGWCVLLMAIDIDTAFDSAKWHYILSALKKRRCPANLYRLALDYFSDRFVTAETESCSVSRQATQGCMQGSPSGPLFWNILIDDLNRLRFDEHVYLREFADDLFFVVAGANVRTAVRRANNAIKTVCEWGTSVSLRFNASKTQILCVGRGSEVPATSRPPVLMNNEPVTFTDTIKYLGVTIDHQLNWTAHITDVCARTTAALSRFTHFARRDWGIGPKALKTIWMHALESAVLYACPVWGAGALVSHNAARLRTLQRSALLRVCRAYSTVSHEALYVLSGVAPILLRIQELTANYYVSRRTLPLTYHYWPPLLSSVDISSLTPRIPYFTLPHPSVRECWRIPPDSSVLAARTAIRSALTTEWQHMWTHHENGRRTYAFLPDIASRLSSNFMPSHIVSQYLTGHGDLREYLTFIKRRVSGLCFECSVLDTHEHRLIECPLYNACRTAFCASVGVSPTSIQCFAPLILDAEKFPAFRTFCEAIARAADEAGVCD